MSSMTFFIIFVCIIAILFLFINLVFAPHNPYQEKYSIFECGFHSFLGQNRTQFGVKFFIFALVYLLLDLEILLTFPFAVSGYVNNIYGLIVTLLFIGIITVGFIYELGKSALKIDSRQIISIVKFNSSSRIEFLGKISKKNYTNTTLNSKMFSFSFFKPLGKHFTILNIFIGLSTIILISIFKWLNMAGYILYYISDIIPQDFFNFFEYFIYGLIGLVLRLGIKGMVEDIFTVPLYLGMDNNPVDSSVEGNLKGQGGNLKEGSSSNDLKENTSSSSNEESSSSNDNLQKDNSSLNDNTQKDDKSSNTPKFNRTNWGPNDRIPVGEIQEQKELEAKGGKNEEKQLEFKAEYVGMREPAGAVHKDYNKSFSKNRLDSILAKYSKNIGTEDSNLSEILKIENLNISDSTKNSSSASAVNDNNVNKRSYTDNSSSSTTGKRTRN